LVGGAAVGGGGGGGTGVLVGVDGGIVLVAKGVSLGSGVADARGVSVTVLVGCGVKVAGISTTGGGSAAGSVASGNWACAIVATSVGIGSAWVDESSCNARTTTMMRATIKRVAIAAKIYVSVLLIREIPPPLARFQFRTPIITPDIIPYGVSGKIG
jgi:hypothetical protein